MITIRNARGDDLERICAIEQACFPAAEAAPRESIRERLRVYPEHFWLLEADGEVVSFVNGMATDTPHLEDEMYENASLHNEEGAWQMIFGVDTHPDFRKKGYAGQALMAMIEDARKAGRKGLVLTCKDRLVHYYARFGFVDEGISDSEHGGVVWHEMRLTF